MKNFKTEWTGSYPSLCRGVWKLYVDRKDKSDLIPKALQRSPMYTAGVYKTWRLENWKDVWEGYEDGLECDDWIKENDSWINKITDCYEEKVALFKAFQIQDFRQYSCGGCIKFFQIIP